MEIPTNPEDEDMETTDTVVTTTDLQSEAHTAAGNLIRAEIGLVRKEFEDEIRGLRTSALAFGASGVMGLLGAHALVETFVVSGTVRPWRGVLAGVALLGAAGLAALAGYRTLPKRALARVAGDLQPGMQVFG
jgi:hypothetical protein